MQWTGLFVVVIALAVATAYGLLRQSRQGRIKPVLATYPNVGATSARSPVIAGQPGVAAADSLRVGSSEIVEAIQADGARTGAALTGAKVATPPAELDTGESPVPLTPMATTPPPPTTLMPAANTATADTGSGAVESAAAAGEPALLAKIGVAGGQVTLLQFSSAFCAPCRATRSVLADVAGRVDGVTHLEVDAESHLDVVRALKIWRTPTTFIIDTEGRIVGRAQGIPQRGQVLAAVTPLLANHPTALQGQPS